jgi:DNA-binding FrmR family transcriptional regulator
MKSDLTTQLKRVRGQIDGIITMIENDRDCLDVVQQILAARNALGSAGRHYLTKEAVRCSATNNTESMDAIIKQLFVLD